MWSCLGLAASCCVSPCQSSAPRRAEYWSSRLRPALFSALLRNMHLNASAVASTYSTSTDRNVACCWPCPPVCPLQHSSVDSGNVQELDDLKGWRSAVSFLLEFGDVATPFLRSLLSRLSAAVSWLLVTLIGRSLGLVFRGVRESFAGRSGKQQVKRSPRSRSTAAQAV